MTEIDLLNKPLVQLLWVAPVEREDGTALDPATEIGEYRIYYGGTSGEYNNHISIAGNTLYTDLDFTTLPLPLFIVMTAVDNEGRESDQSAELEFNKVMYRPKPPTGLSAS